MNVIHPEEKRILIYALTRSVQSLSSKFIFFWISRSAFYCAQNIKVMLIKETSEVAYIAWKSNHCGYFYLFSPDGWLCRQFFRSRSKSFILPHWCNLKWSFLPAANKSTPCFGLRTRSNSFKVLILSLLASSRTATICFSCVSMASEILLLMFAIWSGHLMAIVASGWSLASSCRVANWVANLSSSKTVLDRKASIWDSCWLVLVSSPTHQIKFLMIIKKKYDFQIQYSLTQ